MEQLEALAVGALVHGGIGLVGAHLDGLQTAVLLVLAVVRAGDHAALDGAVGGAGAAVFGTIAHRMMPPHSFSFGVAAGSVSPRMEFMRASEIGRICQSGGRTSGLSTPLEKAETSGHVSLYKNIHLKNILFYFFYMIIIILDNPTVSLKPASRIKGVRIAHEGYSV